jgi:hypothetical protein
MSLFFSAAGKNTPEIKFDLTEKKYYIRGKCFPENAKKHFQPLVQFVSKNPLPDNASLDLNFDYISSSSIIAVLEFLKHIERMNKTVTVTWRYEEGDEDMRNVGMNFSKLCSLNFSLVEFE